MIAKGGCLPLDSRGPHTGSAFAGEADQHMIGLACGAGKQDQLWIVLACVVGKAEQHLIGDPCNVGKAPQRRRVRLSLS